MNVPMTRRGFARLLGGAGALALVDTHALGRALSESRRDLGWLSSRTASAEGAWKITEVDGEIPRDLRGTLYRVSPGQRENHGVALRHMFDGDAFLAAYSFEDGRAWLRARFVDTPERVEEQKAGRMLYDEFGTPAPASPDGAPPKRGKNQPSVNVIRWDGRLLALSEGGHPSAVDPTTLAFQGFWDFRGTLPTALSFTAHPRFDPKTGVGYGYGIEKGQSLALTVYRMERDGTLTKLAAVPQRGYFVVHDMLLTEEHIVFLIPPARFDVAMFFSGKARVVADAIKFFENEPMRAVVLRKDGTGAPVTIELPTGMVFHHGNAFERDGKIVLDSVLTPDGAALEAVYSFGTERAASRRAPSRRAPSLPYRITIDLARGAVVGRDQLDDVAQEFPRYDLRRTGAEARYLYTIAFLNRDEPSAASAVLKRDLARGTTRRFDAGKGRAFGEAVFAPRPGATAEDDGWLLVQGFDAARDRNFVEIRDAMTLDLAARVWAGMHAPLGFHGNFVPDALVAL